LVAEITDGFVARKKPGLICMFKFGFTVERFLDVSLHFFLIRKVIIKQVKIVKFELQVGGVYAVASCLFFNVWNDLLADIPYFEPIKAWYDFIILPFNLIVLVAVVFDVYADFFMDLFYVSRFVDYIETIRWIRSGKFRGFYLHVFHHTTVPVFLRLSFDEANREFLRFVVFAVGSSAAMYTVSHASSSSSHKTASDPTDPGDLFSWDYLQEFTPVQWTQYLIVTIYTVRTSCRTKRFWFGLYTSVFIVVTYQYFRPF
jgi:hypothetical protein